MYPASSSNLMDYYQRPRCYWASLGSANWSNSDGARWTCPSHLFNSFFTEWVSYHYDRPCNLVDSGSRYQIATGAGDDTIRIWDMRSLKSLYTIPAHLSNVADIRFFHADERFFSPAPAPSEDSMDVTPADGAPAPTAQNLTQEEWSYRSGLFFASAGYDGLVKIWSADDWQLQKTLTTDAGKVMSVDISSDATMIASGTYNRNFQLFGLEDS